MIKNIKKHFLLFLVILLTIVLIGCKSMKSEPGSVDGSFFQYSKKFEHDNHFYEIYQLPAVSLMDDYNQSINKSIQFTYTEKQKIEVNSWIINYYDTFDYLVSVEDVEKELLDVIYDNIKESLDEYEKSIGIEFSTDYDGTEIEKEFVVDTNIECDSVLLVDIYIPFRINGYQTFDVFVPVKTFLAYRSGDELTLKCDDIELKVSYSVFTTSNNVDLKK